MPGIGGVILTIALVVFAFTTILGWSYFGEKCWEFLVGTKAIWPFRVICWRCPSVRSLSWTSPAAGRYAQRPDGDPQPSRCCC